MSFKFNWNSFNDENFYSRAKNLLTDALNKSNKPDIIVDKIVVQDLSLGDVAPNLEILEIGDLADDRFRGIFKLNYSGNGSITLATKIQANPLNVYTQNSPQFSLPRFVGASSSLAMPLNLTLSQIEMSGIIILVFSKAKGLTLVFRNDPLESIKVSSTFDALPGIARFLQVQIENQIRALFREELPAILHKLSHRWTPSGATPTPAVSPRLPCSPKLKPITLMEISQDLPDFSPSNMLKLEALCASQKTLNLFTPSIPQAAYRSNLELFEDAKKDPGVQSLVGDDDLCDIIRVQKAHARNSSIIPRRRVIKINRKKGESQPTKGIASMVMEKQPLASVLSSVRSEPIPVSVQKEEEPTPQSTRTLQPMQQQQQQQQQQEQEQCVPVIVFSDEKKASEIPDYLHLWGHPGVFSLPKDALLKGFFSSNGHLRQGDNLVTYPPPPYVA
jgi:distribution and morphology protein 34